MNSTNAIRFRRIFWLAIQVTITQSGDQLYTLLKCHTIIIHGSICVGYNLAMVARRHETGDYTVGSSYEKTILYKPE